MRPTRLFPLGSTADESFDAPAYTRALTPLPEFRRSQAMRAADREDANNRSFNQQFWATLRSETGGVPSGILTAKVARWVSGVMGQQKPAG